MRSLTEETARHQRLADYAELSGFLERIAWMEERMMSMQVRNGQAFAMLQALKTLHLEILSAMTKVKGKS
jgi:hypothetical protein